MSQAAVAKELGISRPRVIALERAAVAKICKALDLESPYALHTQPSGQTKLVLRKMSHGR
jgi:hypothetical protein